MTPRDARTLKQICSLQTDNADTVEGWMIIDVGQVTLSTQRSGQADTGKVTFSRRQFNALIDWYQRDQRLAKGMKRK